MGTKLASPISTGGGGNLFEAHINACFVTLMLTRGYIPGLPTWPVEKIELQGKRKGYFLDDVIVHVQNPNSNKVKKLYAQIKSKVQIGNNATFSECIVAAWEEFSKNNEDALAIITGPLCKTDSDAINFILNKARHSSAKELFEEVKLSRFCPRNTETKLEIMRSILNKANGNQSISDQKFHKFLCNFFVFTYDLGTEIGVVLPLLHSHIHQFGNETPKNAWARILEYVQYANRNAGTITLETIPGEIKDLFIQKVDLIPPSLVLFKPQTCITDFRIIIWLNLIGRWDENNHNDRNSISKILGDYGAWIKDIQLLSQSYGSPVTHSGGIWEIKSRKLYWDVSKTYIFDYYLENFWEVVISVLSERDPAFDLPIGNRYAANIYGKKLKNSNYLRKGFAETLALMGTTALENCDGVKYGVNRTIREVLEKADSEIWGSLGSLLPTLAEAGPEVFLDIVTKALEKQPSPLVGLFPQDKGLFSQNYLSGLLWSLECLAWFEDYFDLACGALSRLAVIDPGGDNEAGRPIHSLSAILLPWFPQTNASVVRQRKFVEHLCRKNKDVAWELIRHILPQMGQISVGTYKPIWRTFEYEDKKTIDQEYWDSVQFYFGLALDLARKNSDKLGSLIQELAFLPPSCVDLYLQVIQEDAKDLIEYDKYQIWSSLKKYSAIHQVTEGAFNSRIKMLICNLEPTDPVLLYKDLFSFDCEILEYDNWEESNKTLTKLRKTAIKSINEHGNIALLIRLAKEATDGYAVGYFYGQDNNADHELFPTTLSCNELLRFLQGYVNACLKKENWLSSINCSTWDIKDKSEFLKLLPFCEDTWDYVDSWMGEEQHLYWETVEVRAHKLNDYKRSIEKLLEFGRPLAAVQCLLDQHRETHKIDAINSIKALNDAISTKERVGSVSGFEIVELIKILQSSPDVHIDELIKIEWAYLKVIIGRNARPIVLEQEISRSPAFFCKLIKNLYRGKKSNEENSRVSEDTALNSWYLLENWKEMPGIRPDNTIDEICFSSWLSDVINISSETGHYERAMIVAGKAFINYTQNTSPWLNHAVATALNNDSSLREGFVIGLSNMRGVHWVDPTGAPEDKLAHDYNEKATWLIDLGYHNLAMSIKALANSYVKEAQEIRKEHEKEQGEMEEDETDD